MMKFVLTLCVAATLAFWAGTARADSIKGRVGVTGMVGVIYPSNSDIGGIGQETDAGPSGGGGIIYGVGDNVAIELDIIHGRFGSASKFPGPARNADFETTDISFGAQYRFLDLPNSSLVPYVGGGVDILINGTSIAGADADDVMGVHLSGGVDYFILKQLALGGEFRGVLAPTADITDARGVKIGNYDTACVSVLFSARYFFD